MSGVCKLFLVLVLIHLFSVPTIAVEAVSEDRAKSIYYRIAKLIDTKDVTEEERSTSLDEYLSDLSADEIKTAIIYITKENLTLFDTVQAGIRAHEYNMRVYRRNQQNHRDAIWRERELTEDYRWKYIDQLAKPGR